MPRQQHTACFHDRIDDRFRLLALSPVERPDLGLCRAWIKNGAAAALDIGRDSSLWAELFERAARDNSGLLGIRIPDGVAISPDQLPANLAANLGFVMLTADRRLTDWQQFPLIVQVNSVAEAEYALEHGVCGLVAKGCGSGGKVGDESSYILLQRLLADQRFSALPIWGQGGIGIHTSAAVIAGGGFGVVIDSQLALLSESALSADIKAVVARLEGTECRVIHSYGLYIKQGPEADSFNSLTATQVMGGLASGELLPLGQDAALANEVSADCRSVESLIHQYRISIAGHLRQARALGSLCSGSALAQLHGTRYPVVQGPMTRVSDTAEFAKAVADNGALPFLALSLMKPDACDALLSSTRSLLAEQSWGVGVLGFAPAEVLQPQLDLIHQYKPPVVLIAGGRPSQARAMEEQGIQAYLHVPAPGLLDMFLKDGARSFVFEGQECGGHIGPRFSFVLWEQQINRLMRFDHPQELNILFAGGIHDQRSSAMVAAAAAALAARGAKIGVLMGSAYIATEEAVRAAAINSVFQQQVINSDKTVLLETAPGHAIRGLDTEFARQFAAEKEKLQAQGLARKDIWARLEALNLGRLRLATKGLERVEGKLLERDEQTQIDAGMYMIGQLAAMRNNICTMAELHHSVADAANDYLQSMVVPNLGLESQQEPVAIIGMDCIYPGSPDLESYWSNILEGKDFVTEVPAERWSSTAYYDNGAREKDKSVSKWGGFIDDFAFDPLDYGIPPQSLSAIEPVQLLSLEVSKRALLDAGYDADLSNLEREKTSVIFGAESGTDLSGAYTFRNLYRQYLGELPPELDEVLPQLTEDSFPGVLVNVIAGRVANRLDLGGVNYTVDSACASSLTAVELAVKELRAGSSDVVLAGGADFHNGINDYLMFSSVSALSATGKCKSFDNHADGIALGEGVGVVVLKRLRDAERDGDKIYAVIDGIAGSSDGKSLGLTAPRKEGQKRALDRAYQQAGVLPGDIGLVEAHGTGTVVGDKTELATLTEIFAVGGALNQQAVLGSVKSQIGHTKCAAGIAGLIKISKALYHRILPSTQNIASPNAYYQPQNSPFTLDNQPRPWLDQQPRAALSAFGFGGTNFHAVLSAYTPRLQNEWPGTHAEQRTPADVSAGFAQWPVELFVFRAATFEQAQQQMLALSEYVSGGVKTSLRDLSFSQWRSHSGPVQCCLIAASIDQLNVLLEKARTQQSDDAIFYRSETQVAEQNRGKLAFLFPGQGSQSPGMLRDIFLAFPDLRDILGAGTPWLSRLYPPTAYDAETRRRQQQAITDTRVAQPTLGMVNIAMARVLGKLGVSPDMVAGHSYGELAALAAAGCFDLEDLLALSVARGESILAAAGDDPGRMAAVSGDRAVVETALASCPDVVLANQNSPTQTVISGPSGAIEQALSLLKAANIAARPIEVACAFHSPVVASAQPAFAEHLSAVKIASPKALVFSNRTAAPYPDSEAEIKQELAAHIVSPVRFVDQIEAMYARGARTFVEVGPGRVLSGMVASILAGRPHQAIVTDRKGESGLRCLLQAIAQLLASGIELELDYLYQGRAVNTLDLSTPRQLSKTTWWINGARAKPHQGALPAHAAKEILRPVVLARGDDYTRSAPTDVAGRVPVASAGNRGSMSTQLDDPGAQVVVQYLNNMRDMVQSQRDVMVSLLGQPAGLSQDHVSQIARPDIAQSVSAPNHHSELRVDNDLAVAEPAGAANQSPTSSPQQLQQCLIDIVSDRTGYPADMLDLTLDLEADLSIDSIKRVEIIAELADVLHLRDQVAGNADALMEQLATKKTLAEMINWLHEQMPTATAAAPNTPTAENISAPQDAESVLLSIVSERTGYPEEALDLDLDLEADLSIDSIKRLEIVGELTATLQLDQLVADKDAALETLASLKTLRAIVQWLDGSPTANSSQQGSGYTEADSLSVEIESDPDLIALSRYVMKTRPVNEVIRGDLEFHNKRILITDDALGVAERLKGLLESHGASVDIIGFLEGEQLPDNVEVDGLIHLAGLNPKSRLRDIKRFFELVRKSLLSDLSYLLVAGGLGGSFGYFRNGEQLASDFGQGGGLAGMVKSIVKEFPALRAHWVDLDLSETVDELAAYLELELLAENPLTEVGYYAGNRFGVDVVEAALSEAEQGNQLEINSDSIVLITGGAQGITAKVAVEMARQYGCQLELVGRSPLPLEEEPPEFAAATDLISLRKLIIGSGERLAPADIEQRCSSILCARAIRRTLEDIRAAGASVNYHSIDVRNIDEFGRLIQTVYEKYGKIDGVIHGAGIVEDKLLRHKTSESFERVFDTKVRGALVLSNSIREDVGFVVFFSSVAGAFGNRGQVDYASANDALDKIAHSMKLRVKGRVLSVNWGPWAGMGMVSEELEREYFRKGVGLIPVADGVRALLRELKHGTREDTQVVLMCASAESMR